jgi:hypothetical protein
MEATTFVQTVMSNPNGYRTTDKYCNLQDIVRYNRKGLKCDTIAQTPGGGACPHRKKRKIDGGWLYCNKASDVAIQREFGKKTYSLRVLMVDGKDRPVLVEDPDGKIKFYIRPKTVCKTCGKALNADQYRVKLSKKDFLTIYSLLQTPLHVNSPKFEFRIVDKRSTRGQLWIALESAERCRV